MDRRDATTWVAIGLTRAGESLAAEGILEKQLRRDLRVDSDFQIFVPGVVFMRNGTRTTYTLMEGYVFIQTGLDETAYFALEERSYISQVISTMGGGLRSLSVVTDKQVQAMRVQLRKMVTSDIPINTAVTITEGRYRNLEGHVIGTDGDNAYVRITLRSLDVVATIPRVFLDERITE